MFSNRWELTTWQIITIYAYRWQIELIFLFLKRTLNGLHLLTHSRNGLENQFYCLLSAALLLLHFKQRNDAATTAAAPAAEPVQVPGPSGPAAAQPQTRSQTKARPTQPSPTAAEPVQVPGPSGPAAAQPQTRSQTEARPTPAEALPSPTAEKAASRLKRRRRGGARASARPSGTAAAQPQTRSQTEARPTPAEAPPSPTAEKSAEPSSAKSAEAEQEAKLEDRAASRCRQPRAAL